MARVPIKIYRLKPSKEPKSNIPVSPDESNLLQGVTLDNIRTRGLEGRLFLQPDNFIPILEGVEPREYAVEKETAEDNTVRHFVRVQGTKYFIPRDPGFEGSEDVPTVFTFYVNPQRITPTYAKLITETRTRGGWEVQHWGEELTSVRVEGVTGSLLVTEDPEVVAEDVTQSLPYKRLMQLKRLYHEDQRRRQEFPDDVVHLGMTYYDKIYIGYFESFDGPTASADQPNVIEYGFSFKVIQETSVGELEAIIGDS